MKTPLAAVFSLAVLATLVISAAAGQMPRTLNYQGTLAIGSTAVPDGNYNVTFRLYTASSGGSAVWTEAQLVSTRNGVFNAILGKIMALPASFETPYWMSLQVGSDPELSPRLEMTAVSYSMQSAVSDSANKVAAGSIGTTQLANNSVTGAKIVDGTITGADVASSTLTSANILDAPGVSSSAIQGTYYLNANNIPYAVDSVSITLPAAGVVVLTANGQVHISHTNGIDDGVAVCINNSVAMNYTGGQSYTYLASGYPTGINTTTFSTHAVFNESAGTKKYYLIGYYQVGTESSVPYIYYPRVTAMYFPVLRGTLSKTVAGGTIPAGAVAPDAVAPANR